EINLQGAHSVLPIWTEFMKRALAYPEYRDVKPFGAPNGVVTIQIDPQSGMPAAPLCPTTRAEVFVAGTEPVGTCPLHGGNGPMETTNVSGWETAPAPVKVFPPPSNPSTTPQTPAVVSLRHAPPEAPPPVNGSQPPPEQHPPPPPKKKGLFRRIFGR